jgi:hypothetical protein
VTEPKTLLLSGMVNTTKTFSAYITPPKVPVSGQSLIFSVFAFAQKISDLAWIRREEGVVSSTEQRGPTCIDSLDALKESDPRLESIPAITR